MVRDSQRESFTYLTVLFAGLLVISNVLAVKLIDVFGYVVPAGVLTYGLTFLVTDTVAEVWGKETTRRLVWAGFAVSLVAAVFIRLAIAAPPAAFWDGQEAFAQILGANLRLVVASMAAYLISQLHDVWAFHFWRRLTAGRHLWLRNNASTLVSQLIDSLLFVTLAFYGTAGGLQAVLGIALSQYAVKVLIALADTPFIYLAVRWVKGRTDAKEVVA